MSGVTAATAAPPSTAELERRVRDFEVRLFHGALLARAAFPVVALASVAWAAAAGRAQTIPLVVWALVVAWTTLTLPFVWRRLRWAERMPWPVRAEFGMFVLLAFLGLGSRSWHVLHAFVPLAFCAFFPPRRFGVAMTASLVAAFWLSWFTAGRWSSVMLERPTAAITPTALALTGWGLVTFVRLLVADLTRLIDAQRAAGTGLTRARARVATLEELRDLHRAMGVRLAQFAGRLELPVGGAATPARAAAADVLSRIRTGVHELQSDAGGQRPASTLHGLVHAAVGASSALGGDVAIMVDPTAGAVVPSDPAAVRRLLTEAVTNARVHGTAPLAVEVSATGDSVEVLIRNAAARAAVPRPGHHGLGDMERDADAAAGRLALAFHAGEVRLRLLLPGAREGVEEAHGEDAIEAAVARRRVNYERGVLFVRLAFALLTTVMLFVKADQHRTLLPAMVASGVVLIAWNGALLLAWWRVGPWAARHPGAAWADALVMVALVAGEGGMSTPWIPLSMGCILGVVHMRSWRDGLALVGLDGLALVAGYWMMRALPVDDAGTLVQDMPFGWVWNMAAYGVVLAIASGMTWVFHRVREAVAAYRTTVVLEIAAMRDAARAQARAEARRELHAKLRQYVAAARLRLDAMTADDMDSTRLAATQDALIGLRDELHHMMSDLEAGDVHASPG